MNTKITQILNNEFWLLHRCEMGFGLPAAPVARQLEAEFNRPLPDVLPKPPDFVPFQWPLSEAVDFTAYWRTVEWKPWEAGLN